MKYFLFQEKEFHLEEETKKTTEFPSKFNKKQEGI